MTKKQDTQAKNLTMEQVYDLLMINIEPDLTSWSIPTLDDVYSDETKEEKTERMERYEDAFRLFSERFDYMLGEWKGQLLKFKEDAIKKLKVKTKAEDAAKMKEIEKFIDKQ
ncbi:hypothetical protein HOF56_00775 [Candidatus Peribacteria bacterium]|jgi:hypothetical protein|nr:hypothetical protein [Candidatus Peribacteria bacterium]MBT4021352.1 hypothetical protein [Candidatus Peribacteria bacterium]MBT4241258.1 hypothetical protein [Candidatus Peribacteria bacterium]MBT4474283.1 hypothetical protein [Candidatus Peribacteria bacterium]